MPSWITHLVTADKVLKNIEVKDKNSFLFGNVMPDILNNYIVKNTAIHKEYETTHFSDDVVINGIKCAFPGYNKFINEYKDNMDNPIICGYFTHLVTDYFWNEFSYGNYFKKHNDLVEVKFIDGKKKDFEYNKAVKIKQSDFAIFADYLKSNYKIEKIVYKDDLLNLSKKIIEIPLTKEDIKNTLCVVDEYINDPKDELLDTSYKLFTQDILNSCFDESIEFIIKILKSLIYKTKKEAF